MTFVLLCCLIFFGVDYQALMIFWQMPYFFRLVFEVLIIAAIFEPLFFGLGFAMINSGYQCHIGYFLDMLFSLFKIKIKLAFLSIVGSCPLLFFIDGLPDCLVSIIFCYISIYEYGYSYKYDHNNR